jgi:hypothetical protein
MTIVVTRHDLEVLASGAFSVTIVGWWDILAVVLEGKGKI